MWLCKWPACDPSSSRLGGARPSKLQLLLPGPKAPIWHHSTIEEHPSHTSQSIQLEQLIEPVGHADLFEKPVFRHRTLSLSREDRERDLHHNKKEHPKSSHGSGPEGWELHALTRPSIRFYFLERNSSTKFTNLSYSDAGDPKFDPQRARTVHWQVVAEARTYRNPETQEDNTVVEPGLPHAVDPSSEQEIFQRFQETIDMLRGTPFDRPASQGTRDELGQEQAAGKAVRQPGKRALSPDGVPSAGFLRRNGDSRFCLPSTRDLSTVGNKDTISKDSTSGAEAKTAELLEHIGRKLCKIPCEEERSEGVGLYSLRKWDQDFRKQEEEALVPLHQPSVASMSSNKSDAGAQQHVQQGRLQKLSKYNMDPTLLDEEPVHDANAQMHYSNPDVQHMFPQQPVTPMNYAAAQHHMQQQRLQFLQQQQRQMMAQQMNGNMPGGMQMMGNMQINPAQMAQFQAMQQRQMAARQQQDLPQSQTPVYTIPGQRNMVQTDPRDTARLAAEDVRRDLKAEHLAKVEEERRRYEAEVRFEEEVTARLNEEEANARLAAEDVRRDRKAREAQSIERKRLEREERIVRATAHRERARITQKDAIVRHRAAADQRLTDNLRRERITREQIEKERRREEEELRRWFRS